MLTNYLHYLQESTNRWISHIENPEHDNLLIISHGWLSGPAKLEFITKEMIKQKYSVYRLNISSTFGTPATIFNEIKEQMESINFGQDYKTVDFLGHSMGGIIIKCLLNIYDIPNGKKFIAAGTPWKGTPLSRKIEQTVKFGEQPALFGNGIKLLQYALKNPLKSKHIKIGLVAGNKPYPHQKQDEDKKPHDGAVSVESAFGLTENVVDKIEVPYDHTTMIRNPKITPVLMKFYKTGKF